MLQKTLTWGDVARASGVDSEESRLRTYTRKQSKGKERASSSSSKVSILRDIEEEEDEEEDSEEEEVYQSNDDGRGDDDGDKDSLGEVNYVDEDDEE